MDQKHLVERALAAARTYEPPTPHDPTLDAAVDARRAGMSLEARVQRTIRTLQEGLTRIDELKRDVGAYRDGLERLAAVQHEARDREQVETRELEDALASLGLALRRERRRRDAAVGAGGIVLGLVLGAGLAALLSGDPEPPAAPASGAIQPAPGAAREAPPAAGDARPAASAGAPPEDRPDAEDPVPPGEAFRSGITAQPPAEGTAVTTGPAAAPALELHRSPPPAIPDIHEGFAAGAPAPGAPADGAPSSEGEGASAPDGDAPVRMRVAGEGLRLRAAPGTGSRVVGVLSRGQRVTVLEGRGGWSRVRVPGGEMGWTASRYLEPLD